jgi:predicted RNA-binding Zn ribbon-like protein
MDDEVQDLVTFLNSWSLSNQTREPIDQLADWVSDGDWRNRFRLLPQPRSLGPVLGVRTTLRSALADHDTAAINRLLAEFPPRLALGDDAELHSEPAHSGDPAVASAVWMVFRLATVGRLARLRLCPDCGWAFYDSSRNGKRVWCAMTAASGGRGCGSIAKTRTYRRRINSAEPDPVNPAGK